MIEDDPPLLHDALAAARAVAPGRARISRISARVSALTTELTPPVAVAAPGSSLPAILIGAALGAIVAGIILFHPTLPPPPPEAPAPAALPASPSGAAPVLEPPAISAAPVSPRSAPPAPPRMAPSTATPPRVAPPPAEPDPGATSAAGVGAAPAVPVAAESAGDPGAEVRLLQRAQEALSSSPARALALTEEHAARFPRGHLSQEREVVAVQALVQLGRGDEARARAKSFLAAFPSSVHRRRLETLVGP